MVERLERRPDFGRQIRREIRRIVFRIEIDGAEALALRRRGVLSAPARPYPEAQDLQHRIGHIVEATRYIEVEADRRLLNDVGAGEGSHAPHDDLVRPVADRRCLLRISSGHVAASLG